MSLPSASGLRVVDLGAGMAAALVAKLLADAGATVERLAPDGDKVFDAIYPAHRAWRAAARPLDPDLLDDRCAEADVCIVGGEDHPDVRTRRDAAELTRRHPRLVVVDLPAYVAGYAPEEPAVDLLVQARSGLAFEHFSARPLCFAVPFPTYGQVLLATLGLWAALLDRLDTGRGQVVSASLQQGAGLFLAPLWIAADDPDDEFHKITPKDVRHLIFECAGGDFVQFVLGVPSAVRKLYDVLGIDVKVDPADRGIPKAGAPPDRFFGDLALIGAHTIGRQRDDILRAAAAVGLPAAPVLEPGEFLADKQITANGILSTRDGTTFVGDPIGWRATAAPAQTARREGAGVLGGLLVLDFGSYVAGPFSSRLLADLGATVVKVEGLAGDPNRGLQRHFLACQMGKRDVVVDLKSAEGAEILGRLLARADVVTHNFRNGVAQRLGLDPESVRRHNPAAITLHTMSFGPTGPRAVDPGFDMVVQALVGLERRAGGPTSAPLWYRTPYLDYATGALGATAVLMARYELRTERRPTDPWVSLLNTGLLMMSDFVGDPDGTWRGPDPLDAAQLGTHPAERLYRTADGWIAVAARNDEQASALWRSLIDGPAALRQSWGEDVTARLADAMAAHDSWALLELLRGAGVWAAPCTTDGLAELLGSAAARASGWSCDRPDARFGRLRGLVGALVSLQRGTVPAAELPAAPARGARTRDVLVELGYSAIEIDRFYAAGVVQ